MLRGIILILVCVLSFTGYRIAVAGDWRAASRESTGQAPLPSQFQDAVVQVYAARAFGARGVFGVHTWIAAKGRNDLLYTVYEVTSWHLRRAGNGVVVSNRCPDCRWYGNVPEVILDLRGDAAQTAIPRIRAAAAFYPFKRTYRLWPGPNSNTFTAFVARAVPELEVDLPPTAVGKDYFGSDLVVDAPSGSGLQIGLGGYLSVTIARDEGFEIDVLGLVFGIDFLRPALKLPVIGRIGMGPGTSSS